MTVRRGAARLAAVCALVGGVVLVGATPALAEGDSVKVRTAGSFTAGGSAESVSIEVRKRSDGCVMLRTALGLRLAGVRADQVEVQVAAGGQWWPVPVSGGGSLNTSQTSPAKPTLCKGKSITVRYRVTFRAGAPAGPLTVVGEATTATGRTIGRGAEMSQVRAGRVAPTPTPKKTPSPTPTPPVETGPPTEDPTAESTLAAVGGAAGKAAETDESGGGLSLVMVFGLGLVAVGVALIVLLFRRSRTDRPETDGSSYPPVPGGTGGTTYRSGNPAGPGGYPAGSSGFPTSAGGYPAGPTGYPPPATPARGTVYPSSPRGDGQAAPGQAAPGGMYPATSPDQGYPAPRSAQSGSVYPSQPGSVSPSQSGTVYPSPRSGQPGTPPPPEAAGGGDSTTIMPRLPE
ncbi:hypothetical protein GA0074692_4068 [Micromonospora pallida]|uniref:Uncharacterized protein n=2 Tax=Micromonospora pallida TaxID=145854 RepID=A0A1C6T1D6_9ACTN|nr:hypothetical protein GA0074692_4068 [Micromonospora pallida]